MAPGVKKVVDFVKHGIESGVFLPGVCLPNRTLLARQTGMSTNTVALAIAQLKREGAVVGVRGQRCMVAAGIPHSGADADGRPCIASDEMPVRTFDAVARRIREDVLTGRYKTGALLPNAKELCARYHTSRVTLRKALAVVVDEKLLRRQGGRMMVPTVALPPGRSRILFIWFSDKPNLPTHDTDSTFIRTLERECLHNSVALDKLIIIAKPDGRINLHCNDNTAAVDPAVVDDCMGIVYLVSWWGCINQSVFDWLAHCGKPVSIMDWLGGWTLPPSLADRAGVQWIKSGIVEEPGLNAGRFLIGRGHRHIAYFSPYALDWPRIRMQGIVRACALAGRDYAVTPFLQAEVLEEPEFQRLTRLQSSQFQPLAESPPGIPARYGAARTHMASTSWMIYSNATYFVLLEPLFERALANKEITAWVGCNDAVAIMALSFLRSKKVRIPGDIALMGFDNTLEAVKADVTSYDLDYEAASSAAVHFILRPLTAGRARGLARPQIHGMIVERGSTARR